MIEVRSLCSRAVVILAACLSLLPAVFAQSDNAQISGFVRDSSGASIPGATVTIKNEATALERVISTNDSGYYVVPNMPPGYYTVTVMAPGFKRSVKSQNRLDASIPTTADAVLQVGEIADTIEVKASVANVQVESATVGRTVEARIIEDMMLNGRNPLFLAQLKPGVRGPDLSNLQLGRTSGGLNINGARSSDYLITIDGAVGTRTRGNGSSIGAADVESLQEMQILTANYNAEYGRSGGGQVRMVTKSGQRDFHGSMYDYVRIRVLDANTWSQNRAGTRKGQNNINQFGFMVSGPVFIPRVLNTNRNKLFFLVSEEWVERRLTDTTSQTVPSIKMRSGDFSELLDPTNKFFGRVRTINDPSNNTPFAGNRIPANRLSANGLAFLNAFPLPNRLDLPGSANYYQVAPHPYS
ncbi:MAG: carboxypeptidase-like regulatory domain-containing protein, partial [Acidobacteriota bacterium]|nr:carboxypeptidase-like regulatory domain-containing protein [Acidobacteriota bacterium]